MPWIIRMLLLLCTSLFVLYGYVIWRLAWALSQRTGQPARRWQKRLWLVAALLNLYPVVAIGSYALDASFWRTAFRGGHPIVDAFLTYPFWIGLLVTLQLFLLFLFLDLARVISRLWRKNFEAWIVRLMLGLSIVVLIYTPIRAYVDTRQIRVREQVIASEKLPADVAELRIVHLSDLQLDPRTDASLVKRYIEMANALRPDLVVFTGDTVTSGTEYIESAAAWLGTVRARYGVYACLGDHDYWADPRRVPESLSRHGVLLLEDASRSIEAGPVSLHLTGVTNIYRRRPSPETLARLAAEKPAGHFSILIAHQPSPSLVQWAKAHGYDLFLAGHTHGGQIALPFFGFRLALARFETPFVSGTYDVGTLWVNVTNGLGLTAAPLRFHAPAEIVLLRIVPMRTESAR
ncbi:MAG: metallophosphoesterase [Blastocatellia bacterium]|nr:metallophosphoesterase [Blastocatellia bacterium]MCS7157279.1 metallophosphoesterase [Blastocatellia bacterium]MCX7752044.1 metallophosphoesterase [Blastocatellia bacterium]MDW8167149.1 metallophosphoesterase [Acidobacteriota bacterium]MDW8257528.1 metallophosphoesterase [Acidobacteriota bacterium]